MYWIESVFHLAPDGGTGALELALASAAGASAMALLALLGRRLWVRQRP
jgi:hypothetical protein